MPIITQKSALQPLTKTKNRSSVFIVVLQYNNSADTIGCLESLKGLAYPDYAVIVVDNHSRPDELNRTEKYIKSQNDRLTITLIKNPANLGYSGGNNVGIRKALEQGADYVLILNPDTTVRPDLLAELVTAGESGEKVGLVGPIINESEQKIYGGRVEWLQPELTHIQDTKYKIQDARFYLPGACLLIKRAVIEQIGWLDENYFLYFEDADYCQRAQQVGWRLRLVPEALVSHRVSSSTRALGAPLLLRYHFRNALYFNWRHAPLEYKVLLPLWSFWIILKQFGKWLLRSAKRPSARAILAGVFDFHLDKMGKIADDQSRDRM